MFIERAAFTMPRSVGSEMLTIYRPRRGGVLLHRIGYKDCAPNGATFEAKRLAAALPITTQEP